MGMLAASGGLIWFEQPREAARSVASVTELTRHIEAEFHPGMSPDGTSVVHVRESVTGNNDIWVTRLDGESRRMTEDIRSELHPSWSPDGQRIAYLRATPASAFLMLIPASGGESKELVNIGRFDPGHMRTRAGPLSRQPDPGPAWSPDGKEIAFRQCPGAPPEGCPLFAISTATSQVRKLTAQLPHTSDFSPAWSPDGRHIAFARFTNLVNADLYVVPATGGEPSRVTNESHNIKGVAWTPDSKALVFASNRTGVFSLWKVALGASTVTPVYSSADNAIEPAISKNGDAMVFTDAVLNSSVWCFDIEQQAERQLIRSASQNVNAAFSPNGKRTAFASNRLGSWQLWSSDADGTQPVQLTRLRDTAVGVIRWSPDGKQIAFDGQTGGHSQVLIVPADGGAAKILKTNIAEPRLGNWSRDGKSMYFMAAGGGRPRIWKAPASGGTALQVVEATVTDLVESSDGKRLFVDANRAGGLLEVDLSSGRMQPVKGLEEIRPDRWWTLTAASLYFYDTPEGEPTIFSYSLADQTIKRVTALGRDLPLSTPSFSVSPDGKHVIYTRADEVLSKLMIARGSFRGR
jgi:Tol biopolymer transport system component